MPCYVNGQISGNVPAHGSPAACAANGGFWEDEISLMNEGINPDWENGGVQSLFTPFDPLVEAAAGKASSYLDEMGVNPYLGAGITALATKGRSLKKSNKKIGPKISTKGQRTEKKVDGSHKFDRAEDATIVKDNIFKKPVNWMKKHPYSTGATALTGAAGLISYDSDEDVKPKIEAFEPPEAKKPSNINWDEVSKLGRLMAHYGTPLSKRKEHPSVGWDKNTANAAKAAAKAASFKIKASQKASELNETTLLKMFTPDSSTFLGPNKQQASIKGASMVAKYEATRALLIEQNPGRVVTHGDVMTSLKNKYGKK